MFAGTNGMDSPRRALIDFDIAANVPTSATITSVQLTSFLGQVAGNDQTPRTIGLYELTADWGEGTTGSSMMIGGTGQGFPANPGDATWNARFFPGTLWTTPGGDHNATASATSVVGTAINAPYTWQPTPALVSDVQAWLNTPATNFGWELINLDESTATDFRAFYTRDFSGATPRPQLQVTFTPLTSEPEPASVFLVPAAVLFLTLAAGAKRLFGESTKSLNAFQEACGTGNLPSPANSLLIGRAEFRCDLPEIGRLILDRLRDDD